MARPLSRMTRRTHAAPAPATPVPALPAPPAADTASAADRPPDPVRAHDLSWAASARSAAGCSALLFVLLLALDLGTGGLTGPRAVLWLALGALLFAVLTPPRVSAGEGVLVSRGLLRRRSVRTDRLVAVRRSDGVAPRLVLRDAFGGHVALDPDVLVGNPPLWRLVDAGARLSTARGSLLCGATALRQVSERIDRETARTVFEVSGLE